MLLREQVVTAGGGADQQSSAAGTELDQADVVTGGHVPHGIHPPWTVNITDIHAGGRALFGAFCFAILRTAGVTVLMPTGSGASESTQSGIK